MNCRGARSFARGLVVVLAAGLPLGACSTGGGDFIGAGAFGDNQLQRAEVKDVETYPADRALAEARAHFRNNDFGYSAQLYKRFVELQPGNPEGYIGLGASYDRLRRFDLSDRVYASWYALSGGTAQYYNNLGYSYLLRGDLTTALAHLRKAQQIDPQNATVANNLQLLSSLSNAGVKSRPRA